MRWHRVKFFLLAVTGLGFGCGCQREPGPAKPVPWIVEGGSVPPNSRTELQRFDPGFGVIRYTGQVWIFDRGAWRDITVAEMKSLPPAGYGRVYVVWGPDSVVMEMLGKVVARFAEESIESLRKELWTLNVGREDFVTSLAREVARSVPPEQARATGDLYVRLSLLVPFQQKRCGMLFARVEEKGDMEYSLDAVGESMLEGIRQAFPPGQTEDMRVSCVTGLRGVFYRGAWLDKPGARPQWDVTPAGAFAGTCGGTYRPFLAAGLGTVEEQHPTEPHSTRKRGQTIGLFRAVADLVITNRTTGPFPE